MKASITAITVIFVHGWSVTTTESYGQLPEELRVKAAKYGFKINQKDVFLSQYISFQDEVRMEDLACAFNSKIEQLIFNQKNNTKRFVCISHSTGGPLLRLWQQQYYNVKKCPISHLIMLAPANFGSSLIKFGKAEMGHLKSGIQGSQPGTNILNWLTLGSESSWDLNESWICSSEKQMTTTDLFSFVLTGQTIDRKMYDPLNHYTGEMGSDGVIRLCSANLNARYIRLEQKPLFNKKGECISSEFEIIKVREKTHIPFKILSGRSHSGENKGIMRGFNKKQKTAANEQQIKAIFDCLVVESKKDYRKLCKQFEHQNNIILEQEKVETAPLAKNSKADFIHDSHTQIIFRVRDNQGYAVEDFDLIFTAGDNNSTDGFPQNFCVDLQKNGKNKEIVTYYLNFDLINGSKVVKNGNKVLRDEIQPIEKLGFKISARPTEGFVRYLPCVHPASKEILELAMKRNATVMVDIILQRVVSQNLVEISPMKQIKKFKNGQKVFRQLKPSTKIIF